MSDRYDKEYAYGMVTFYLSDFWPDLEECRILIFKVLEQTIRDYHSFKNSILPAEKEIWLAAKDFLFDNDYRIKWGDLELKTEEFLDIIDLDIEWVRDQIRKKSNGEL